VCYLGSAKPADLAPDREVIALDRKGAAVPDQDAVLKEIAGVVLIDGTWSQAKRSGGAIPGAEAAARGAEPEDAVALRRGPREPRSDSLSTLEATGLLLSRLEGKPEIEAALAATFERMLARLREQPGGANLGQRSGRPQPRRRRGAHGGRR